MKHVYLISILVFAAASHAGVFWERIEGEVPLDIRKTKKTAQPPTPNPQSPTPDPQPPDHQSSIINHRLDKLIPIDTSKPITGTLRLKAVSPGYRLEGTLRVEETGRLEMEPGVLIFVAQKGRILIKGAARFVGSLDKPIAIIGIHSRPGAWQGIFLLGKGPYLFQHCIVRYAGTAFHVRKSSEGILTDSLLADNQIGIFFEEGRWQVGNVAILRSLRYGVLARRDEGTYRQVTIADGHEMGYYADRQGAPTMLYCEITRNRGGGVRCDGKGRNVRTPTINHSNLFQNEKFQVFCNQPNDWDCRANYWGSTITWQMRQRREQIKGIIDGRDRKIQFRFRQNPRSGRRYVPYRDTFRKVRAHPERGIVRYDNFSPTRISNAGVDEALIFHREFMRGIRLER